MRQWSALQWSALLFVLTFLATLRAGVFNASAYHEAHALTALLGFHWEQSPAWWATPAVWGQALGFAVTMMGILLAHEMGHYLTARRRGVPMSPPFFLPWFEPLGTLGAVIAMDATPTRGTHLLRVAVMGPFAGMLVALPALVLGLAWSEVLPVPDGDHVMGLGVCLLMKGLELWLHPGIPPGHDVYLHPVALAGWAGCLITSLNLLPIGQLDGGHTLYAMVGDRFGRLARIAAGILMVGAALVYPPWLLLLAILWYAMGIDHPPMLVDGPVGGRDRWLGWGAAALFLLTFTPRPIIGAIPGLLELL